jgi:hypothetical protein
MELFIKKVVMKSLTHPTKKSSKKNKPKSKNPYKVPVSSNPPGSHYSYEEIECVLSNNDILNEDKRKLLLYFLSEQKQKKRSQRGDPYIYVHFPDRIERIKIDWNKIVKGNEK